MMISRLHKNIAIYFVPLVIIAGIADAQGYAIGDWKPTFAVGIASFVIHVADYFIVPQVLKALGDTPSTLNQIAAMSAINAFISLGALYTVGII